MKVLISLLSMMVLGLVACSHDNSPAPTRTLEQYTLDSMGNVTVLCRPINYNETHAFNAPTGSQVAVKYECHKTLANNSVITCNAWISLRSFNTSYAPDPTDLDNSCL